MVLLAGRVVLQAESVVVRVARVVLLGPKVALLLLFFLLLRLLPLLLLLLAVERRSAGNARVQVHLLVLVSHVRQHHEKYSCSNCTC